MHLTRIQSFWVKQNHKKRILIVLGTVVSTLATVTALSLFIIYVVKSVCRTNKSDVNTAGFSDVTVKIENELTMDGQNKIGSDATACNVQGEFAENENPDNLASSSIFNQKQCTLSSQDSKLAVNTLQTNLKVIIDIKTKPPLIKNDEEANQILSWMLLEENDELYSAEGEDTLVSIDLEKSIATIRKLVNEDVTKGQILHMLMLKKHKEVPDLKFLMTLKPMKKLFNGTTCVDPWLFLWHTLEVPVALKSLEAPQQTNSTTLYITIEGDKALDLLTRTVLCCSFYRNDNSSTNCDYFVRTVWRMCKILADDKLLPHSSRKFLTLDLKTLSSFLIIQVSDQKNIPFLNELYQSVKHLKPLLDFVIKDTKETLSTSITKQNLVNDLQHILDKISNSNTFSLIPDVCSQFWYIDMLLRISAERLIDMGILWCIDVKKFYWSQKMEKIKKMLFDDNQDDQKSEQIIDQGRIQSIDEKKTRRKASENDKHEKPVFASNHKKSKKCSCKKDSPKRTSTSNKNSFLNLSNTENGNSDNKEIDKEFVTKSTTFFPALEHAKKTKRIHLVGKETSKKTKPPPFLSNLKTSTSKSKKIAYEEGKADPNKAFSSNQEHKDQIKETNHFTKDNDINTNSSKDEEIDEDEETESDDSDKGDKAKSHTSTDKAPKTPTFGVDDQKEININEKDHNDGLTSIITEEKFIKILASIEPSIKLTLVRESWVKLATQHLKPFLVSLITKNEKSKSLYDVNSDICMLRKHIRIGIDTCDKITFHALSLNEDMAKQLMISEPSHMLFDRLLPALNVFKKHNQHQFLSMLISRIILALSQVNMTTLGYLTESKSKKYTEVIKYWLCGLRAIDKIKDNDYFFFSPTLTSIVGNFPNIAHWLDQASLHFLIEMQMRQANWHNTLLHNSTIFSPDCLNRQLIIYDALLELAIAGKSLTSKSKGVQLVDYVQSFNWTEMKMALKSQSEGSHKWIYHRASQILKYMPWLLMTNADQVDQILLPWIRQTTNIINQIDNVTKEVKLKSTDTISTLNIVSAISDQSVTKVLSRFKERPTKELFLDLKSPILNQVTTNTCSLATTTDTMPMIQSEVSNRSTKAANTADTPNTTTTQPKPSDQNHYSEFTSIPCLSSNVAYGFIEELKTFYRLSAIKFQVREIEFEKGATQYSIDNLHQELAAFIKNYLIPDSCSDIESTSFNQKAKELILDSANLAHPVTKLKLPVFNDIVQKMDNVYEVLYECLEKPILTVIEKNLDNNELPSLGMFMRLCSRWLIQLIISIKSQSTFTISFSFVSLTRHLLSLLHVCKSRSIASTKLFHMDLFDSITMDKETLPNVMMSKEFVLKHRHHLESAANTSSVIIQVYGGLFDQLIATNKDSTKTYTESQFKWQCPSEVTNLKLKSNIIQVLCRNDVEIKSTREWCLLRYLQCIYRNRFLKDQVKYDGSNDLSIINGCVEKKVAKDASKDPEQYANLEKVNDLGDPEESLSEKDQENGCCNLNEIENDEGYQLQSSVCQSYQSTLPSHVITLDCNDKDSSSFSDRSRIPIHEEEMEIKKADTSEGLLHNPHECSSFPLNTTILSEEISSIPGGYGFHKSDNGIDPSTNSHACSESNIGHFDTLETLKVGLNFDKTPSLPIYSHNLMRTRRLLNGDNNVSSGSRSGSDSLPSSTVSNTRTIKENSEEEEQHDLDFVEKALLRCSTDMPKSDNNNNDDTIAKGKFKRIKSLRSLPIGMELESPTFSFSTPFFIHNDADDLARREDQQVVPLDLNRKYDSASDTENFSEESTEDCKFTRLSSNFPVVSKKECDFNAGHETVANSEEFLARSKAARNIVKSPFSESRKLPTTSFRPFYAHHPPLKTKSFAFTSTTMLSENEEPSFTDTIKTSPVVQYKTISRQVFKRTEADRLGGDKAKVEIIE